MIKELGPFTQPNMVKRNICICFTLQVIFPFGVLSFSVIKDFQKKCVNSTLEVAVNTA